MSFYENAKYQALVNLLVLPRMRHAGVYWLGKLKYYPH